MNRTRKMWASAGVVGVILAGGFSVAAAASSGGLGEIPEQTRAQVEKDAPEEPSAPDSVVSTELNPDPQRAVDYWTDERVEGAQPMPMPEVKPGEFVLAD
jgi:hypothetical protein